VPQMRLRIGLPSLPRNIVWLKLNTGQLLQDKYSLVTEVDKKKSMFHKIMTSFDEVRWNSVNSF